jgi:heme/copper-type cytochrome/quinol oxidase subunit 3
VSVQLREQFRLTRFIREATFEEQHSTVVQNVLKLGVILFIISEVMFFFAFFWAFFHERSSSVLHH